MSKITCRKLHVSDLKTGVMSCIIYKEWESAIFLDPISLINKLHQAGADNLALALLEVVAQVQDKIAKEQK